MAQLVALFLLSTFELSITKQAKLVWKLSLDVPQCSVYCVGPLLETVQTARLYNDSKTFVDMPMKSDPSVILAKFMDIGGPNASRDALIRFLSENFLAAGSEVISTPLLDWKPNPGFLDKIKDINYRGFALKLHQMWDLLGKKLSDDVFVNPSRYSVFPVKRTFIVPGGRFREFYYWDTYWIMKGLLVSELYDTAKGEILNMLDMVSAYGFVPNGARIYYLTRSQPPLLAAMVDLYYQATNDVELVLYALPLLEQEYSYWMTTHSISVPVKTGNTTTTLTLNRYYTNVTAPRPESYNEDLENAGDMSLSQSQTFFSETVAGAESGWDFSSRWFGTADDIKTIKTRSIIPVDLNSFLYKTEAILDKYYHYFNLPLPRDYKQAMQSRLLAMNTLMWNPTTNQWHDYDLTTNAISEAIFPSNFLPMWCGAYEDSPAFKEEMVKVIENSGLIQVGGVLTSTVKTVEQWDLPNAWAPIQSLIIDALQSMNTPSSLRLAQSMALNWIKSNYIGLNNSGYMHEKYNAFIPGQAGNGGEYAPQVGFGWTNGVILDLLQTYGFIAQSPN